MTLAGGYPVLFLDVDGVLNDHYWNPEVMCGQIHQDKVDRLNRVLRATGARIVLSSAWRYIVYRGEANLMGLEWLLRSHQILADRLIGITRKDTEVDRPPNWSGCLKTWVATDERGNQIRDWIRDSGHPGLYAAVDDLDPGITAAGIPLVRTDGSIGMTDDDADRLVDLLLTPSSDL